MTALAACATKNGASRFSLTTAVTRFDDAVAAGTDGEPPALLTATSSRPKRAVAAATTALACSGSRTSAAANSIPAGSEPGWVLPQTRTLAPDPASRRAIARPMPRVPPVTSATRPAMLVGSAWPGSSGRLDGMPDYGSAPRRAAAQWGEDPAPPHGSLGCLSAASQQAGGARIAHHAASLTPCIGRFQSALRTWPDAGTSFRPSVLTFYPASPGPDGRHVLRPGQHGYVAERVRSDRDDVGVIAG